MLSYDTGICCYAFIKYFKICSLLLSIPFSFFFTSLKYGIDKSTEWSTVPACPSLMCFFNKGDTEGTNSSKILCSMFMFYVILCTRLILRFLNNLWFDGLRARVNRRQTEHCFKP